MPSIDDSGRFTYKIVIFHCKPLNDQRLNHHCRHLNQMFAIWNHHFSWLNHHFSWVKSPFLLVKPPVFSPFNDRALLLAKHVRPVAAGGAAAAAAACRAHPPTAAEGWRTDPGAGGAAVAGRWIDKTMTNPRHGKIGWWLTYPFEKYDSWDDYSQYMEK